MGKVRKRVIEDKWRDVVIFVVAVLNQRQF